MDIPESEAEARQHIAKIRKDKRLDVLDSNSSDLENALILLSEQLYQNSIHFLLELIQNADDNTYLASEPTLNITFSERMIRIDSNEVGFSKANTEAICKIGRSTKKGLDKTTRYIGEKGIGYKSVFKIADVVWILSGHYSFKFDKIGKLGMIAPIWTKFPEARLPGFTSMCLQLTRDCDTRELLDELKSMDPRLLIFLRKLRQLNIVDKSGTVSRKLSREDCLSTKETGNIIRLLDNLDSMSYKIVQYPISGLPSDPKRPGCSESEILLAFPVGEDKEPLISSQKVYAFLPIRDYGFKFLIQADFLLTVTREDIDSSSQWNRFLLNMLPSAFRRTVHELNEGELRYTWMRYLPSRFFIVDFFEELENAIIRALSTETIIESLGGDLHVPSNLSLVQAKFSDDDGLPFVQSHVTKSKYLSPKYSVEKNLLELSRLGVKPLTPEQFIDDLDQFISYSPNEFQGMSGSWHSSLSRALFRLIYEHPGLKSRVSRLNIVPLKDGRWQSTILEKLCFTDSVTAIGIPKRIPILEIHPDASADLSRRNLFILLGAQTFSKDMVCQAIISTHASPSFSRQQLSRQDLISHALFLYHAGWKNFKDDFLWLSTETGAEKRSYEVYVDSEQHNSASAMFESNRGDISFVHGDYFEDISILDGDFKSWLIHTLHLADFPRLVPHRAPKINLSPEFQLLLRTADYLSVLKLLRDRWEQYTEFIIPSEDPGTEAAKVRLREKIAGISVKCQGGITARLKETMLPLNDISTEHMTHLSFIDLPDPESRRWKFLSHFGVVVDAGVAPFIQGLQLLKEGSATLEQASELYKQIFLRSNGQEAKLRGEFSTQHLIFAAKSSRGRSRNDWINTQDCVWDGPSCLQKTPCLRDFYKEHAHFFCLTLGLGKADWRTLMNEAQSIEAFDDIEYISEVFISISDYLQEGRSDISASIMKDMVTTLTDSAIFPIRAGRSKATFDYLSTGQATDQWFIADREHLAHTFEGLVPLLALKVEKIGKIASLVKTLGWENRMLSGLAEGIPETAGGIQLTFDYTNSIVTKARFIARLIPTSLVNRAEIIEQLCKAKVYTAERVSISWTLKTHDGSLEVVGRADSGRVRVAAQAKSLEIYIRKSDADISRPPYELREELSTFCCLTDASHISLLHWLISEPHIEEIEALFKRKGLQNDVPELEALSESLERGKNPQFWDSQDPGHIRRKVKRHYHGKPREALRQRKRQAAGAPSLDVVQSFMAQFEKANSWNNIASRPWREVGTEEMLAHLCRLESIDPYTFLAKNDSESAWNKKIKKAGAYPDDPAGFLFHEDPMLHKKNNFLRPAQRFPAVVEISKNEGIYVSVSPTPVAEVSGEILLAGEIYVSKLFEREMKDAYKPDVHWTSYFRNRSGVDPFMGNENEASTFTIQDNDGSAAFTQLLVRHGYKKASSWLTRDKLPNYHIEVSITEEDIMGKFILEPFQVQKAWLCHKEISGSLKDVFILIRISDVRGDPTVALFVDPWQLHAEGNLQLASECRYVALFETKPSFITLQAPGSVPCAEKPNSAKRRIKLFSRKEVAQAPVGALTETFYAYKTLKIQEIRLLELKPGKGDSPVQGTVQQVTVDKASVFWAISYAWGPALKPYFLETSEGKMPLTASLYSALKRLRSATEPILLWADAICIDQSNDYEKALQIRLLPTIFQSAEQVFAWVGGESDNSHVAMETLMQIRALEVSPDEWPEELPRISTNWHKGVPHAKSKVWKYIAALFEREWFQRIWIIQEIVLAADVRFVCGDWEVDWDDIFAALQICLDWSESLGFSETRVREMLFVLKPAYGLGLTRKAFKEMKLSPPFKLIALLDSFAHTQSTKECDKLFALLGISSDAGVDAFDPDYHSSVESIVRRYAAEFVRRGSVMDILYRAGLSKSYAFSSWIPKWTSNEACRTISTWRGANGIFVAGGTEGQHAIISTGWPDQLRVAGMIIDRVASVGSVTTSESDIIAVVSEIQELIDDVEDYPTGESKEELKLKLPIGNAITPCSDDVGAFHFETELDEGSELFDWNNAAFDVCSMQDMIEFLKQNADSRDLSWKYWTTAAAFLKRLSCGRFAATKRGYIGFGPHEISYGDLICLFNGAAVPFVLRPTSNGIYKLVGECYIHGICRLPLHAQVSLINSGITGASVVIADSFVEGYKALLIVLFYGLHPIFTNYECPHFGLFTLLYRHWQYFRSGKRN